MTYKINGKEHSESSSTIRDGKIQFSIINVPYGATVEVIEVENKIGMLCNPTQNLKITAIDNATYDLD
jgi:hypothetical protein